MDQRLDLLHDIDKRLAVLEQMSLHHTAETQKQLSNIQQELSKLKVRVAGIAGTISIVLGAVFKWFM